MNIFNLVDIDCRLTPCDQYFMVDRLSLDAT